MFETFAGAARAVVVSAQQDARRLRHHNIGTEHLLMGLAAAGSDPASQALQAQGVTVEGVRIRVRELTGSALDPEALAGLGIDLAQVRRAAEERFGVGALNARPVGREPKGHIPFDVPAKKVLALAVGAARAAGVTSISTGHLLIGIIDEGNGLAVRVLRDLDVDLATLRTDVIRRSNAARP